MKKYVFAYYGEPHFQTPEAGKKHMAEWRLWVQKLGKAMTDPGVPLNASKTVSSGGAKDGAGPHRLTGYSVVEAESIEDAVEMAKSCPHLHYGTIDVAEVMAMSMRG
jgi:hypothetical protein